jgi:glycosyltransferase involved in cell wall biosynthesis
MLKRHLFGGGSDAAVFQSASEEATGSDVIDLGWRGETSYPGLIGRLKKCLSKREYDAIVSFGFYPSLVTWVALCFMRRRPAWVCMEINSPRREYEESRFTARGEAINVLRRKLFRAATLYAANSMDGCSDAARFYGVPEERIRRVPNLIDPEAVVRDAGSRSIEAANPTENSVVIVGSLTRRKRVDILIRAAALLPREMAWRIDVVGDGPEREKLSMLAEELGLAKRVVFHGYVKNPFPNVKAATLMALCSEFEGFSNSVLEALVLGTPVIATETTSDMRDAVARGAVFGVKEKDPRALADAIKRVWLDECLREALRSNGRLFARPHELSCGLPVYEKIIIEAIQMRQRSGFE